MSDTIPVLQQNKPRGFAAMTPEQRKAAQEKSCATRLANKAAKQTEVIAGPPVTAVKDEFDRKLDYFQYSMDEAAAVTWETDEATSPVHVPQAIKDKYPNFEFRWVSKTKLDSRGEGYNGWQLLRDPKFSNKDGLVVRGNDLFLGVMPKEFAERYRAAVAAKANSQIERAESGSTDKMEQAMAQHIRATGDDRAGMLAPGEALDGKRVGAGTVIGARGKFGKGGQYSRAVQREKVAETIRRNLEDRAKHRTYAFLGER